MVTNVRRRHLAHLEAGRRHRQPYDVDDHGQRGRAPAHVAHAQAGRRETIGRAGYPNARRLRITVAEAIFGFVNTFIVFSAASGLKAF